MSRNKILAAIIGVLVIAGVAWYFASPAWAMSQLKDAALAGDRTELAERVDFPAVRESMKSQLQTAMMAEMAKQSSSGEQDGWAALGGMIVMGLVGPVVDAAVTPDGIKMLVERGKLKGPGDAAQQTQAAQAEPPEWTITRSGFDRFTATPDVRAGQPAPSFVFKRDGLGWKLVDIEIPKEAFDRPAAR